MCIIKDVYDPTVGNSGLTCDLPDNPYVTPHPHQGDGERIDYILYRSRNGLINFFSLRLILFVFR